jgi:ketosteroid isomerase-like protein
MGDAETAKAVVRRFLGAIEAGDEATIEALQAPECTWWIIGHGPMSRTEYSAAVRSMLLSAERRRVTVSGCIAEGDTVAAQIESELHFGPRVYRNQYHDLFVVREGLIVHGREYFDTAAVAAFRLGEWAQ